MGNTYISAGEAAKLAGVTTPTISKALKSGKLSYVEKLPDNGGYKIDPAEVLRVYPPKKDATVNSLGFDTPATEVETLRERLGEKDQIIADLRKDRDAWRDQAQTLALSDQRGRGNDTAKAESSPDVIAAPPPASEQAHKAPQERRGLLAWIFGRETPAKT